MYGSVSILRRQLVTKPGGQPVSEPTPPGKMAKDGITSAMTSHYDNTNGRLAIPALAGLLVLK